MSTGHQISETTLMAAKRHIRTALSALDDRSRALDDDYQLAKAIALEEEATEIRRQLAARAGGDRLP